MALARFDALWDHYSRELRRRAPARDNSEAWAVARLISRECGEGEEWRAHVAAVLDAWSRLGDGWW